MVWNTLSTDEFVIFPDAFLRGATVSKCTNPLAIEIAAPELPYVLEAIGPR
jgi:hypothetical protein